MRIGSLFSGYGGLDLAVEAAFGASTAWVSDIDTGACKILAHRFPDAPNLGDITTVDWTTVEPVDVICGGSPCQDLSHAGRRRGMTGGTRSNTWVNMREAIATLRPTYVIWENVRGAFSASADSALEFCPGCMGDGRPGTVLRALGRVLGDLSDLGYDTEWRGLRAADVGACHGRFRVFVVARLADAPSFGRDEGWTESAGLFGGPDAAERRHTDGPLTLLPTPAVNDMGKAYTPEEWDAWTAKMQAEHGNGNGHGKSLEIEVARLLPTPVVTDVAGTRNATANRSNPDSAHHAGTTLTDALLPTPMTSDAKGIGPADFERNDPQMRAVATKLATGRFGDYAPAIARWATVLGRPAPAPTEPTGRGGAHRLSPRFTEWMMGVPDGWITDTPDLTRNEALKACGNGVVPQQAHAAITDCRRAFALDVKAVAS